MRRFSFFCAVVLLSCTSICESTAEVITDGSMGAAQNLTGPAFTIPENLGTLSGNNLFHSFQSFNIGSAESAVFTGSAAIQNVVSRVTGGSTSTINGTLSSTIGNANFYFINPAGVVFGPTAWVDVPASFHVSTADYLLFADGKKFSASDPDSSSLSVAEPESFGFTGSSNGDIQVDRSLLWLKPGNTLSLVGGNIRMDTGLAAVEGGSIRLIANGNQIGQVPVSGTGVETVGNGELLLTDTEIDGEDSTDIFLSGGKIILNSSNIYHTSNDPAEQGSIVFRGRDLHITHGSTIGSINNSEHPSAPITIKMDNEVKLEGESVISSEARSKGKGGNIEVSADSRLTLLEGSYISSNTADEGDAGDITVRSRTVTIDGMLNKAGIVSESLPGSSGRAADVRISGLDSINIFAGGVISSNTFGQGDAGSVYVDANHMTIDGKTSTDVTGISSEAGKGSTGNAGKVSVKVAEGLKLIHGGVLSSSTWGGGNAGYIQLTAGNLLIAGQNKVTGITTQSNKGSSGDGGSISVNVRGGLSILSEGSISSSTQSTGNAGSITVHAGNILIDGLHSSVFTGIESRAEQGAGGSVGNITIDTENGGSRGSLVLKNGAEISIAHYGSSSGGKGSGQALLAIDAGKITLSGESKITSESTGNVPAADILVSSSDILDINGSSKISTESNNADAGDITVSSAKYMLLKNGLITTSVGGSTGSGGDIAVATPILIMDTGFIQANTQGKGGRGGAISVDVKHLIGSYGTVEIGGGVPLTFEADSHVNIIQAAAPEGAPGNIDISVPVSDITGSLLRLSSDFRKLDGVRGDPCKVDPGTIPSSLTVTGRGGLPPFAADPLSVSFEDRCE